MKKTALTILESIADKLGDKVVHKFMKEFEELDDKREAYDYDSYMLAFLPFEETKEVLSQEFVKGLAMENQWAFNSNQSSKIEFVYKEYDFINAQVEELITKYEGSPCCHDKSSTLVRMYVRYLATGELPDVSKGDKEFWKPACGTAEEWMNFIDSTLHLHQGRVDAYFDAYQKLTANYNVWFEAKRERLDHTLTSHAHFIEKGTEDDSVTYAFEGDGKVTANLLVDERLQVRYRYNEPGMEELSRKERYKWEQKPWFKELLKQLN